MEQGVMGKSLIYAHGGCLPRPADVDWQGLSGCCRSLLFALMTSSGGALVHWVKSV